MSCFNQSLNEPVAAKVMLSDVEGQKVVSPASVQPSGGRNTRPWVVVAAIAVACVVIGVAVGVPVGLAANKNSKQSSPQQVPVLLRASWGWTSRCMLNTQSVPVRRRPVPQDSVQVRGVNTSALSLHLQDATTDAVHALNAAFRHLVSFLGPVAPHPTVGIITILERWKRRTTASFQYYQGRGFSNG